MHERDIQLHAVFVLWEYGYTAYLEQLPWVITEGKTIEEAEENLHDALEMYLS